MNTDQETCTRIFRAAGAGWVLEGRSTDDVLNDIHDIEEEYRTRFGKPMEKPLLQRMQEQLEHFKPLVQALGAAMSAPIRTMIFCLLDRGEVRRIEYHYEKKRQSALVVEIAYENQIAEFVSDQIWDAAVLRHFGLMRVSGLPYIDGYYAWRGPSDSQSAHHTLIFHGSSRDAYGMPEPYIRYDVFVSQMHGEPWVVASVVPISGDGKIEHVAGDSAEDVVARVEAQLKGRHKDLKLFNRRIEQTS